MMLITRGELDLPRALYAPAAATSSLCKSQKKRLANRTYSLSEPIMGSSMWVDTAADGELQRGKNLWEKAEHEAKGICGGGETLREIFRRNSHFNE